MFIGDGAKMVRDAFALAREKAPAIIFVCTHTLPLLTTAHLIFILSDICFCCGRINNRLMNWMLLVLNDLTVINLVIVR
jgi:hypothetical protein